ncbi:ABC transporter ATP-binding protein [Deinococcus yavapaiensis]|uniref:ABC-2 type transport system ATP-binding protein n=1 Tax=Deinococcus yavapaiensis KR-236 TaxID=694435 RepID=A0A318S6J4_9DEIO|nr:ABC transporter ATP-binding protein [Deinococcus yavapaiensis]PYE53269.1 ABC-2 type transport system ATP-binding protein [Deinococcus yavapaiensis KR-236]
MTQQNVIQTRAVQHAYGDIAALRGVDLDIPRGTFFALLGPNGAGKSTLVSILSTLLRPTKGEASVAGYDVRRQPGRVRRELGLVFQEPSLDERLTVIENLDFHGHLYGLGSKERARRAWEVLELVELTDWANGTARILSRGMKRRLEIGRAVMHDPSLLILDEPTVGLDVQSRHRIWTYLNALRERTGVSILLTTHQIEEAENADLVAIIDRGEVLQLGVPAELRAAHGDTLVTLRGVPVPLRTELEREYPHLDSKGDTVRLRVTDPRPLLADLARTSFDVRAVSVQSPSLEDVFLDLTGRQLRDDRADPREATLAFARRGGEHTR